MGVVEVTEYCIELVVQKENMIGGVILVPMKAFNSNCIYNDGRRTCAFFLLNSHETCTLSFIL